jgi:gamma-glutamylcyclotransferase (GGCT)/AIG2-like uncharacterized protein YtfP
MVETTWDLALAEALCAVNARRRLAGPDVPDELEQEIERRFGASRRLAVYGSLAPGAMHHHVLADLAGEWQEGIVTGMLHASGWGAAAGYPLLRWRAGGPPVAARLLVSDALPQHWPRLDEFEGPGYARILVPVHAADGVVTAVANLYADATDA